MMKCPKCKTEALTATKLESGLPAMGCHRCHGALLSMLYYRDWAERTDAEATGNDEAIALDETVTAALCPKCGKLMRKFLMSEQQKNRLDLCTSCDEVWLDQGEWQQLKKLGLLHKLPKLFTDGWQKQLKTAMTEHERAERLARTIGDSEFQFVSEFQDFLKHSPHRVEILHYLSHQ